MQMFLTQYCIIWVSTVKGYKYAVNMLNNYKYDFFLRGMYPCQCLKICCLKTKIFFTQIADANGDIIPHQVSLIWKSEIEITRSKYELSFVATIPPLGLVRYSLKRTDVDLTGSLARTEVYHIAQPESR